MTLNPKDWERPLADGFHPRSFVKQVSIETLGKDVTLHRTFERAIPSWRWPLWGVAFEEITTGKGSEFQRTRLFGDDWHRESAPNFMMVPVALGKERSVVADGCSVIKHSSGEFVVNIFRIPRANVMQVVGTEETKGIAEKFFGALDKWVKENNFYRGQKIDARGKFLHLADVEEADLVLPADIKRELFRNVSQMVEKWEDYARFGIPGKRGVIMAGPPGNGKTLACKVLAKKLDCTFMWCTPRHVMEADGFSEIYEFAREIAPTVVLLEDADVFGLDRRIGGFSPLMGELLNCLDGLVDNKGVITVLSSNYAEVLDTALTHRPGRFDTKLMIGPPEPPEAFELLRRTMETRKVGFTGDVSALKQAASMLAESHASGAYIVECVNYAMILAVERGRGLGKQLRMDVKDLQDSVSRIVASLSMNGATEKAVREEGLFKWGSWGSAPAPAGEEE